MYLQSNVASSKQGWGYPLRPNSQWQLSCQDVFSLVIFLLIENALEAKIWPGLATILAKTMPKLAPSLRDVLCSAFS
jgi:hypothetical protein